MTSDDRMVREGMEMESGNEKIKEEMEEVQKELEEEQTLPMHHGRQRSLSVSARDHLASGARNLFSLLFSPVFVQTFVLTFLAEWGDRSQITTIALGAAHVCIVTYFRMLYWLRWERLLDILCARCWQSWEANGLLQKSVLNIVSLYLIVVTLGGAFLFLCFGIAYLYEGLTWTEDEDVPLGAMSLDQLVP